MLTKRHLRRSLSFPADTLAHGFEEVVLPGSLPAGTLAPPFMLPPFCIYVAPSRAPIRMPVGGMGDVLVDHPSVAWDSDEPVPPWESEAVAAEAEPAPAKIMQAKTSSAVRIPSRISACPLARGGASCDLAAFCRCCHILHDRAEHPRRRRLSCPTRRALGDLLTV